MMGVRGVSLALTYVGALIMSESRTVESIGRSGAAIRVRTDMQRPSPRGVEMAELLGSLAQPWDGQGSVLVRDAGFRLFSRGPVAHTTYSYSRALIVARSTYITGEYGMPLLLGTDA